MISKKSIILNKTNAVVPAKIVNSNIDILVNDDTDKIINNNIDKVMLHNITPQIEVSKKIALVGNSNSLINGKYGEVIDSFDDVIRFNFADIGNPKITGTKTTIRWINCPVTIESATIHNAKITEYSGFKNYTIKVCKGIKVICWESLQTKLKNIDNTFDFYVPNEFCTLKNINDYLKVLGITHRFTEGMENCWPRTGFQAIITCIRSGAKAHLFGFDIECKKIIKHYSQTHNYYTNNITQHQIENEIIILNELKNKGYIIVHK